VVPPPPRREGIATADQFPWLESAVINLGAGKEDLWDSQTCMFLDYRTIKSKVIKSPMNSSCITTQEKWRWHSHSHFHRPTCCPCKVTMHSVCGANGCLQKGRRHPGEVASRVGGIQRWRTTGAACECRTIKSQGTMPAMRIAEAADNRVTGLKEWPGEWTTLLQGPSVD